MYLQEIIHDIDPRNNDIELLDFIEFEENKVLNWLKTIVAFANTSGGTMYIGVNDKSHHVHPLDYQIVNHITCSLHSSIQENISPHIQYHISTIKITSSLTPGYIICLKVDKSNVPVILKNLDGLFGIYVRDSGETIPVPPEQVRNIIYKSIQNPFDQMITDFDYHPEDFTKLFNLLNEKNVQSTEKDLISNGFMNNNHKLAKGALFFKDDIKTIETRIIFTVYKDKSKESHIILAQQVYANNLLDIIKSSIDFILNHSINGFKLEGNKRISYYSYPLRSIITAIVNAIAYCNYYIHGSQIEINMFEDRLEITTPGSLLAYDLRNEKNISQIIPCRRNKVIHNILKMCGYFEENNSDYDVIEEDYRNADEDHKPFITCDHQSFTSTLPNLLYKPGIESYPDIYLDHSPKGKHDLEILSYCFNKKRSIKELTKHLGLSDSSYFRHNIIKRLLNDQLLIESISSQTKYYQANHHKVFIR